MSHPMEPKQKPSASPALTPDDIAKLLAKQQPRLKQDDASPSGTEQLQALLAKHTVIGHVFLEITVGPEWAAAALERDINVDNRPMRVGHIRGMARAMQQKRYRDKQPHPICFSHTGRLLDGQHRLSAVVASGCTIVFTICFGCDPEERDYYDQGAPRSVSDIAREHGHMNTVLAQSVVALILRVELEDASKLDRTQQTERLDELFAESGDFEASLRESHKLRVLLPPTTAALAYHHIASHTEHRDRLPYFWDAVSRGANLTDNHPALRVRNQLISERGQKTNRDGAVKKAGTIVLAWNAVLERKRPRSFKWDTSIRLPEVV